MYIPIFSKDIEKFENKKVSVIGKVIDIQEEKKLLRVKIIDPFGYINVVFFEYFDIKIFDTLIILGKVSNYDNGFYIIGKYFTKLKEKDEIFWRKIFIKKNKKRKKENINMKEDKEEDRKIDYLKDIEDEDIKLRKEILDFIRNNDKGEGVSYEEILNFFGLSEEKISNILKDLLSSGEIYESSPNKYKII